MSIFFHLPVSIHPHLTLLRLNMFTYQIYQIYQIISLIIMSKGLLTTVQIMNWGSQFSH